MINYNDQINRFALFTLNQLDSRSDLFGMRVTADGVKKEDWISVPRPRC